MGIPLILFLMIGTAALTFFLSRRWWLWGMLVLSAAVLAAGVTNALALENGGAEWLRWLPFNPPGRALFYNGMVFAGMGGGIGFLLAGALRLVRWLRSR